MNYVSCLFVFLFFFFVVVVVVVVSEVFLCVFYCCWAIMRRYKHFTELSFNSIKETTGVGYRLLISWMKPNFQQDSPFPAQELNLKLLFACVCCILAEKSNNAQNIIIYFIS